MSLENILNEEEKQDIKTLYQTFPDTITSIYFTNSTVIPFLESYLDEIEIALILNDIYDTESNKLVELYVQNYKEEHLGTRLHFILRYLNDPVNPLFHVEGEGLTNYRADLYKYYFMNLTEPIEGQKLNFNIDILSLANADYVLSLFEVLIELKRAYTRPDGELLSYTRPFYSIMLTTYVLLKETYNIELNPRNLIINAYVNTLNKSLYKKFRVDFLELLKKYDIDF